MKSSCSLIEFLVTCLSADPLVLFYMSRRKLQGQCLHYSDRFKAGVKLNMYTDSTDIQRKKERLRVNEKRI